LFSNEEVGSSVEVWRISNNAAAGIQKSGGIIWPLLIETRIIVSVVFTSQKRTPLSNDIDGCRYLSALNVVFAPFASQLYLILPTDVAHFNNCCIQIVCVYLSRWRGDSCPRGLDADAL
jgi:hypothetical protein